jgi:ParB-like chromosome segregation protein Spo0J
MRRPPRSFYLDPDNIDLPPGRAPSSDDVAIVQEGIAAIGQKMPISVRKVQKRGKISYVLVAGAKRRQACINLGKSVECREETGDERDAEMWEVSENLHRVNMDARAQALATNRWRELRAKVVQVGPPSKKSKTGQKMVPGSVRDTAKKLGISKTEVIRRDKIASVIPEAAAVLEALPPHMKATEKDYLEMATFPKEKQVERARMVESLKAAALGMQQSRERKKARRVLPDQDEAAQSVAISVRDFEPPILKHANKLFDVCEHMTPTSRQRLARACAAHAEKWFQLALGFCPKGKASKPISSNAVYQEWVRADAPTRKAFLDHCSNGIFSLDGHPATDDAA